MGINTICISNLIVFGEAKRLEDSLIGERVAWLLVDTDVLRRTEKHRIISNYSSMTASRSPCRTPDWRCVSWS